MCLNLTCYCLVDLRAWYCCEMPCVCACKVVGSACMLILHLFYLCVQPKRAASLEWVCHEWIGVDEDGGDVVETSSIKSHWRGKKRGRDEGSRQQQSPEDDCEMARLPVGKRHLCDKGCFFWEYEAARSLAMLRTRLSEQGACLSVCRGWSARIETGCKGSGRRVVYQSACGQIYATSRSALSALLELGRSAKRSRMNSASSSSMSSSSSSSSSSPPPPPPPNYQVEMLPEPHICLKPDQRQVSVYPSL